MPRLSQRQVTRDRLAQPVAAALLGRAPVRFLARPVFSAHGVHQTRLSRRTGRCADAADNAHAAGTAAVHPSWRCGEHRPAASPLDRRTPLPDHCWRASYLSSLYDFIGLQPHRHRAGTVILYVYPHHRGTLLGTGSSASDRRQRSKALAPAISGCCGVRPRSGPTRRPWRRADQRTVDFRCSVLRHHALYMPASPEADRQRSAHCG